MHHRTSSDTLATPAPTGTATLAMGCFWKPDALFGSLEGVVRTRVGYAGGSTTGPTYWAMADHIETLQLDYDPEKISYQQLLHTFFASHTPTRQPWKRQYSSAIFYHTHQQREQAAQSIKQLTAQLGKPIYTCLYPCQHFYLAEERHQKYKLQRQAVLMEEFQALYPNMQDFINSTAAARVKGYLYGYGSREKLLDQSEAFGLSPAACQELLQKASGTGKPISCAG
ncbi:MAG: peptide-methionine (S)-S-oxide reductase MsrA [Pontibacter sp.]|nr:peptide-methionine (S)-S-oxide reductase MsrA [Pontibacter sp.]